MISERSARRLCSDDVSLIENYHEAITDQTKMWEIHHRRECDSEGRTLFTRKQLIEMGLYFKRPAPELVFMTRSMHNKLHREIRSNSGKIVGKKYGKKYGAINGKKSAIKLSIPIIQFSKDGTLIKEWPSAKEAYSHLGISPSHICACLKGRSKSAGGFVWRYK